MHTPTKELNTFLRKNKNKKIVFTNGCFDIMHIGHIYYLNEARKLGDLLVVGLNSDESIKTLKGDERPINRQIDRKTFLENIRAVDFVEIFYQDTPIDLIKTISPNILVKGGDWREEDIVGSSFVKKNRGKVLSLSFKAGHSSTNLIEKIRKL